jgi:opacity protein-like surface antigen
MAMKVRLLVALVVLLCVGAASAQFGPDFNYTPAAEVFGGFSLHRTQFGDTMQNAPGFDFNFGYNPFKYMRLLADVGGQYHGTQLFVLDERVSTSNYQLLFGPEFVMRNKSRYTPFVHGMFGWVTRRYNIPNGLLNCNGFTCSQQKTTIISDSGLGLAAGGGLDIAVSQSFSVRAIQFDYIRSHMDRNQPNFAEIDPTVFPPLSSWQKNYRFAFGVVFRIGEKGGNKY